MKTRTIIGLAVCAGILIVLSVFAVGKQKNEPIVIREYALLEEKTMDDFIEEAEVILIGTVGTVNPSRWDTVSGDISPDITLEDIYEADIGIFTDTIIGIGQILKGNVEESTVRVRSFRGEVGNIQWISDVEPTFVNNSTYLLFLVHDYGPTADIDPGDYISVNAIDAVYEIIGANAISAKDEWVLEDLIAYIQNALQNSQ